MRTGLAAFQWQEEDARSRSGEGISHPKKGARTKMFELLVRDLEAAAMKIQLRAENKTAAIKYCKARWPGAAVEVLK